ncbi:MAG: ATP-binding protein [Kordiimonadales bacterium]|nr:MAG: ATP-binding protein [Kordiimonadales bacterium]
MRYCASSLRRLTEANRIEFLRGLSDTEAAVLAYDWQFWARETQLAPPGSWTHWLMLAGRGFGKTRAGAEWVRMLIETGEATRIALVAPTLQTARSVMVEGDSGLLAISPPWNRPKFEPSKRQLVWPSGAIATLYSAEDPERLRGPQHHAAWCDELCSWRHAEGTWDNLLFGLRLGVQPRSIITTTPKPTAMLKGLIAAKGVTVTRGTTFDNLENLAPSFADEIIAKYEGTRTGRQELMAELLEDVPGALWKRRMLDQLRVAAGFDYQRIVVAVDPPASVGEKADECGIVAAGLAENGQAYVLADASEQGLSPAGWARKAVALYHSLGADRIVIESNQGGAMAEAVLREVDPSAAITQVFASRGKHARAEPVAALYEQGRVHHVGTLPILEDQMCSFTGELQAGHSPDRVDALVWAITHLMLTATSRPKIRSL